MNKKYIISKNEEIEKIIKKGNKIVNKYYIIYSEKNDFEYNRYAISVSKKLGNAVIRNKLKRRTKEIIRISSIKNGKNYVIILRKEIFDLSYQEQTLILTKLIEGEKK